MSAMLPTVGPNPFLEATAWQMLEDVAARFPQREAIVAADRRITYAAFVSESQRMARALLACGVGRDDKVAVWLPNRPAWLFVQQACAMIGAVLVALNTRYKAHELSYILGQSDSTTLILTDHLGPIDFLETLAEVLPGLRDGEPGQLSLAGFPKLTRVIMDAEDPYPGCLRLSDVLEAGGDPEWERALKAARSATGPDDPWTILYTSGTTSFPKGAVISHRNTVPHGWYSGKVLQVTEADRVLHALPATGTWGGLCVPLSTFAHGACLILMETFEAAVALHLIEREGVTIWNAVDAMVIPVLDHPDLARCKRGTLRTGGFASTGGGRDGLFEDILHMLGVPQAYQPYGMTELNALSLLHALDETDESRAQSGAWAPEGLEVRVVDSETGRDMPVGREGELWFRGPLITRGYYKKPEETAKAFTADGWFKSGDLGVRDAEGRTLFKGRLREALRISHFMVAPAEIEAYIMTHSKVSQAFVIGVPDPKMNEAAVAYVIPKHGERVTEAEIVAHCQGKIASYKVPRHVRVVDDVPRAHGPHGDKVQKGKLRELFLAESKS
jgi:fatty-acyl-CoA synthase